MYYPIWLAYATGMANQEYDTLLIDAPARGWDLKETLKKTNDFNPNLIVIDTSFPSLKNDLIIAETLKERTDATIVTVGPPTSVFSNEILKSKGVDIVAKNEYEFTVKEIADALSVGNDLKCVKGILYKNNGQIRKTQDRPQSTCEDLDKLPFVTSVYKQYLNLQDYFLSSSLHPEVQIFAGRGCPFSCTFCLWPQTFTGRTYRVRSISNLVSELEYIQQELPQVKEVVFEDDTFTISRKYVQAICNEIINRKLDITWNCQIRATLDYETMKLMKRAGCRLVIVGFESGDEGILKNIKKGITVNDIKTFSKNIRKAGLLLHADFILGLPGEKKETISKTKNTILMIKPDLLQVSVATPYPGTEFYNWAVDNGYLNLDYDALDEYLDTKGHQQATLSYPNLSSEEITEAVRNILKWYYLTPRYIPILLRQILRKHGLHEARRIWLSARAFNSRLVLEA